MTRWGSRKQIRKTYRPGSAAAPVPPVPFRLRVRCRLLQLRTRTELATEGVFEKVR